MFRRSTDPLFAVLDSGEKVESAVFHRLGSVADDGVARLRRHSGLEHFLPHPGHSHLKAADVTSLTLGPSLSGEAQQPAASRPGSVSDLLLDPAKEPSVCSSTRHISKCWFHYVQQVEGAMYQLRVTF